MSVELKVPPVGESITEVVVGRWLVAPGAAVAKDQVLAEIETDKVTLELLSPVDGVLATVHKAQGEGASVGDVIALLTEGEAPAATTAAEAAPVPTAASPAGPLVMPAAQRELAERGLSATDVAASGPGGRLLKEDVLRHAATPPTPAAPAPAAPPATVAKPGREEEVVPLSPLRLRIAERLVEAQSQAALLTTFNELDMSAVMALRREHQEAFTKRWGVKLGFMSFFVKAAVEALKAIPAVNATMRGNQIVYHNYYDVGVAIGGGKGLVVPILRNAERLSFADIEKRIADFAERAKTGKITLDELAGGTFSISNGGVYGSLLSTPIVNPPQSGILGLHAINDRPIARAGQVVIAPMMYIALTYDHRLVDGREAVTFLKRIKDIMEQPARMLLEV